MSRGSSRRLMRVPICFGITGLADILAICSCFLRRWLLRRRLHLVHDVLVAGAAAEVALEAVADLVVGRIRVRLENRARGHDHAGRAVAALEAVLLPESFLHRVELV